MPIPRLGRVVRSSFAVSAAVIFGDFIASVLAARYSAQVVTPTNQRSGWNCR
jgi:hypothetical protein